MKDNCKKIILELSSYLDGALDATMQGDLELHLSRCTDCRLVGRYRSKNYSDFL